MEMSNARVGMWLFIASDSATFAALLLSYLYLRAGSTTFTGSGHALSGAVMTAVLLASSVTMFCAGLANTYRPSFDAGCR